MMMSGGTHYSKKYKKKIIKMASAPFVIVNAIDIFRNCYKADPFIKCPSVHKNRIIIRKSHTAPVKRQVK